MANMKSEKILAATAMLPKINALLAELGYEIRDFSLYRPGDYAGCKYGAGITIAAEPVALHAPAPEAASLQGRSN
jgi:hypothetical protein